MQFCSDLRQKRLAAELNCILRQLLNDGTDDLVEHLTNPHRFCPVHGLPVAGFVAARRKQDLTDTLSGDRHDITIVADEMWAIGNHITVCKDLMGSSPGCLDPLQCALRDAQLGGCPIESRPVNSVHFGDEQIDFGCSDAIVEELRPRGIRPGQCHDQMFVESSFDLCMLLL